ncbi:sterol desaturase family protein [Parasphingorhabdus halotolerans]|uniref:Sterol desaturase family protein n=1 Tax=Parasphingorhabdus halotolerans TaxID=2725558 RepID=A0A6H2DLS2_9SPHN|nr:sterol desaturase family protein [Parasphingorhabdus halotolerans]QJB68606.1 sterol desaturase family protein [Parasphingorhabdus halotolerans]
MRPEMFAILGIFLLFGLLELFRTNLFSKPDQTPKDALVEIIGSIVLTVFTQPFIILSAQFLMGSAAPQLAGALANIPLLAAIGLFLVFDDMTQYWMHRLSHRIPFLYNLHRAHHDAKYMSVRLVYRNNIFYYFLMPSIWFSGVLIYLGLGWVYVGYIVVKMAVIVGAHSDVAWDKPLYNIKALSPIMWVVERIISTPATHHAHHGRHMEDGATNYKGNYGNLLFFWDILFGTAKITRRYPDSYGVENLAPATLGQQLAWPIFPENKEGGYGVKELAAKEAVAKV